MLRNRHRTSAHNFSHHARPLRRRSLRTEAHKPSTPTEGVCTQMAYAGLGSSSHLLASTTLSTKICITTLKSKLLRGRMTASRTARTSKLTTRRTVKLGVINHTTPRRCIDGSKHSSKHSSRRTIMHSVTHTATHSTTDSSIHRRPRLSFGINKRISSNRGSPTVISKARKSSMRNNDSRNNSMSNNRIHSSSTQTNNTHSNSSPNNITLNSMRNSKSSTRLRPPTTSTQERTSCCINFTNSAWPPAHAGSGPKKASRTKICSVGMAARSLVALRQSPPLHTFINRQQASK
mmetsp:Transcript_13685/g.29524  ORF Transcript_13685/g.29524 Transcript_13685/m.29524 type:complete len:291 (+) Transcript_13685:201-1073(+)